MSATESIAQGDGGFVARFQRDDGFVYETDVHETEAMSLEALRRWVHWNSNVATGTVESIYYILSVPDVWPGPPEGSHRYSGLRVKIGRARDVMRRLADLRTGTPSDLIIHALEPGSPEIEARRHREFSSDRRQGEWFACSPRLTTHIFAIWKRNNALPREHQIEVLLLQDRIDALIKARRLLGGPPQMVNPSIDEPWEGTVLLDLAYSGWRVSVGRPIRPGAIEIDPASLRRPDLPPHEERPRAD